MHRHEAIVSALGSMLHPTHFGSQYYSDQRVAANIILIEEVEYMMLKVVPSHPCSMAGGYKYLWNAKCAPSQLQVDEYEQDLPGCLEITPTNFMIDSIVFAKDFLDKVVRHSWYASANIPEHYHNHETIHVAFIAHLAYVKAHYRELVTAVDEDPDKARQATNAHLQKYSHGSRKVHLLKICIQDITSDKSKDKARRMISYPCVYPAWHSEQLATLLWQADDVAATNATVLIGKHKKAGTQLWLHPHSGKVNTEAAAPPGLPHNCYNASWLTKLHSCQVKALHVQDKDYDFSSNSDLPGPSTSSTMQY
ncbi:hypothetical protein J3A83DRAFT_4185108 [Scleroderma citrinum]